MPDRRYLSADSLGAHRLGRRRGVPLLAPLVALRLPVRLRHAARRTVRRQWRLPAMSRCFHFSRCTTACWRGPARSGWSRAWAPPELERSIYTWAASLLFIASCASGGSRFPGTLYVLARSLARGSVRRAARRRRPDDPKLRRAGRSRSGRRAAGAARPPGSTTRVTSALETDGLYGFVRHPLYFAWALMVFAAPDMTATRADVRDRHHGCISRSPSRGRSAASCRSSGGTTRPTAGRYAGGCSRGLYRASPGLRRSACRAGLAVESTPMALWLRSARSPRVQASTA